ncbi:glutamyl-tRNA amidotransferase [Leptolyngbya sp. BL0902]|uniref:amidase n=1 Tax=Leptolyngbya sp. BL0902 TaxID=1115757 RepID=UPI0018E7630F|nr:amidase [Leptolyngbya sp. BL0902]QQE64823.1 glutamyl-tRNA amidotransferase [Leptolyngbya sp. BL0902]
MGVLPLHTLTASELAPLLHAGEVSAQALAQACLDRIVQREPVVDAWEYLDPEYVRHQSRLCDQRRGEGHPLGPLHGIPVAVKDIFATTDMPTGWGTPIYAGQRLPYDAAVVERLRAAGAVILGKTVTTEYAHASAGKTRNPYHPGHTPGGSSSGSAAAVADRMVPLALGSQTAGSILRPAAYCGILGFKPSFGLISRHGTLPVSRDLDHVGVFGRSLEDITLLCRVLIGPDGRDPDSLGAPGLDLSWNAAPLPHFAFVPTPFWHEVEPQAQTALAQSLESWAAAGASVTEISLPNIFNDYLDTLDVLLACGMAAHHGADYDRHRDALSPTLRQTIERGRAYSGLAYATARQAVVNYSVALAPLFDRYDALITPVTTGIAPAGLDNTGSFKFCALWSICGVPALSLPLGRGEQGLPLGLQLVGQRGQDGRLLRVAEWAIAQLGDDWLPPLPDQLSAGDR